MNLNSQDWLPITFQGIEFPPSLMAITVLEPILGFKDEDLGAWLWRLTICRGVTKSAPAESCVKHAQQVVDLLLEDKRFVVDGIRECLTPHGFDPEETYVEWITSMQKIAELSQDSTGDCSWSAPAPAGVNVAQSAKQFLRWLESQRKTNG